MLHETPIVYYRPGCPHAVRLRVELFLARVPHRSVRFRDDEEGAAAVRARHEKGYELSPTVVIGNEHLTNPSLRQVREAVDRL
jgi:glutaredoxin